MTKNIHLIFLRKDEAIPYLFKDCEKRIRDMHSSWNVVRWNEDTGILFLRQSLPEYIGAYLSFPHNIQKADFLRLALVYALGGFYLDLDMLPLRPLDNLTDCSLVLAEEKTIGETEQRTLNLKYRTRIANYMFGGAKGHPFLRHVMNVMAQRAPLTITSQQEILDITGPGLLTDTYWDNVSLYPDITLLRSEGKYHEFPNGHRESCLFGNYAVHLHTGTWRKGIC